MLNKQKELQLLYMDQNVYVKGQLYAQIMKMIITFMSWGNIKSGTFGHERGRIVEFTKL